MSSCYQQFYKIDFLWLFLIQAFKVITYHSLNSNYNISNQLI
ncbi:protein of unknown function [Moritella yayanosii]|uniref:Uncharacterized protein n=1 Tax=Moritella yayanosii TaxID=69539 RepID=A0A330LMN2_9GAMM|nr:protein of unknown function [Moritella yayanosii]